MQDTNTFKYLIKIAGKILFVIGLVLNVLMVFFGFWPSLIYLLIMLAGAGMFSFNKEANIKKYSLQEIGRKIMNSLRFPSLKLNSKAFEIVVKRILLISLGVFFISITILWLAQSYFKKRDTRNDCNEIVLSLTDYYKQKNRYPNNLSTLISNNPMRQSWYIDHWGNSYSYRTNNEGKTFTLISAGGDGKFNTKDDLFFESN